MKKVGKRSILFDNVYLKASATISGPKEKEGPLGSYFDHSFDKNYCNEENWEQAEIHLQDSAINIVLSKIGLTIDDIGLIVGGDLNNQLGVTNYTVRKYPVPFLGVYSACTTLTESLFVAATMVESSLFDNVLTVTSSHNSTSERQFRYPTEYGAQKPSSTTFTATGAGTTILSRDASSIKITKATIGKIIDPELFDAQDMGRTMAPAAADTLIQHLDDFGENVYDYDLILTGDLSKYGSDIFLKILKEHNIDLTNRHSDAGLMLYDIKRQHVYAGGSGCGCVTLVTLSYIIDRLKQGVLNKVLIIATGALMNPVMTAQNESIPAISHAICLERSYK